MGAVAHTLDKAVKSEKDESEKKTRKKTVKQEKATVTSEEKDEKVHICLGVRVEVEKCNI
jgi:hypothetical protein